MLYCALVPRGFSNQYVQCFYRFSTDKALLSTSILARWKEKEGNGECTAKFPRAASLFRNSRGTNTREQSLIIADNRRPLTQPSKRDGMQAFSPKIAIDTSLSFFLSFFVLSSLPASRRLAILSTDSEFDELLVKKR